MSEDSAFGDSAIEIDDTCTAHTAPPNPVALAALSEAARTQGATVVPGVGPKRVSRSALLRRGHRKIQLLTDMASEEFTEKELADRWHTSVQVIRKFAEDFAHEIAEQRKAIQDGLKTSQRLLWIQSKEERLAGLQQLVEQLDEEIALDLHLGRKISPALAKVYLQANRNIAEELGQLRTHVEVDQKIVHSVINGVNPEDLK